MLAAMPLLVGCDEFESFFGDNVGKEVSFSADTYYQNNPFTKTEYSGYDQDNHLISSTSTFERIDWVDGDQMRIWATDGSTTSFADYEVESHETDASAYQNSKATIKHLGEKGIRWMSEADHTFYALYPSPEATGAPSNLTLNGNTITATMQSVITAGTPQPVTDGTNTRLVYKPDMNYAYMWAATQNAPGTKVSLGFKPLMTTFEFSLGTINEEDIQLESFVLSTEEGSPALAGDFVAAINSSLDGFAVSQITNASPSITVNFGGVTINATQSITFTIFALPQDLTNLTMTLNLSNGVSKHLSLKRKQSDSSEYQFITFDAGKKYFITNMGVSPDGWVYTLQEVEQGAEMAWNSASEGTATKMIKSYKTKGESVQEVQMSLQYSPADNDGNCTNNWSPNLPSWLNSLVVGSHTDEQNPDDPFTLTGSYKVMPVVETETVNEINEHIRILKENGSNEDDGFSSGKPQDLALYDINNLNSARSTGAKTANSYVVDKAGWYMFPLVYGNAIDWDKASNGLNVGSYYDGLGDNWDSGNYYVLHRFRNYLNNGITSPYILDDIGLRADQVEAVIVWEDVSGDKLFINTADVVSAPTTTAVYKELEDGTTDKTVPYIKFDVDETNIRQGNAVIALREKEGENRIIWSWHIWVTDTDLSTLTVQTRSSVVPSNQMLKVNLGWCDTKVITEYSYTPRKYFVKVSQVEGNAAPVVFAVTQTGPTSTKTFIGSATFYQYGRKDPFLPMMGELMDPFNKESYSPAGYPIVTDNTTIKYSTEQTSSPGNVSFGIQNPYIQYGHTSGSSYGWVTSKQHNLWDVTETSSNGHGYQYGMPDQNKDKIVVKSVYDPCPPGFSVPNYMAFTIFTTNGGNSGTFTTPDPETEDGLGYLLNTTASGGEKIFFPYHGFRSKGLIYPGPFYILNSKADGDNYHVGFNIAGPMRDLEKSNAYHVRPVKEMQ